VSLKEIAQKAGVSIATASRVLNNPDYHCTDEKKRERIWKAAMELHYVPNEAARNLKKGKKSDQEKTKFVQILMTRSDNSQMDPFFDELLHIIETELHKGQCILTHVWHLSMLSSERKCRQSNLEQTIRAFHEETEGKSNGIIIVGKVSKLAIPYIKKYFKNVVAVNRNSSSHEIDEVVCDGKKIARLAMEHLLELDHQDIGYVGECGGESRYKGYVEVLEENKIDFLPEYVFDVKATEAEGYAVGQKIMKMEYPPSAVYCANDIIAVGLLKAIALSKNKYFSLSVISSDNIELSSQVDPMLTTVALPKNDMGRFAVKLLLDRMNGQHTSEVSMELMGKILVRNSAKKFGEEWSDYVI